MTNVIPQAPNVNQKAWAQLEMYCRDLVKQHNRLYVMSGPIGQGGTGSKGYREFLAGSRVTVPAECWKVIVVVPEDGTPESAVNITAGERVIAVDMPNDQTQVGEAWDVYRCRPSAIEQKTGLHFFTAVQPAVASALEQKLDDESIPEPRPMTHSHD
jgi:endonuclease G